MDSIQIQEYGGLEVLAVNLTTGNRKECGLYQKRMESGLIKG